MAGTLVASPPLAGQSRRQARRRRRSPVPYALVLPAVAVLLLGLGYPVYWQVVTSLQEFGLAQQFGQPPEFVGLDNYARIFSTEDLWAVVVRSVLFCLVNAVVTVLLGLAFALLMRAVPRAVRIAIQVSLLLAWAMPMVAAVTVWRWLFDWRPGGVVNWLLVRIGLDGYAGHNWLAQQMSFFFVATVIIVWMSVPFVALSLFAGLTQVPEEVLEAAKIDGARPGQTLRYILLPMVRPVLAIVFLLQIIWDLRVFAQIRLLQDSGAAADTDLLGNFIFELGIGRQDFAGAAAVSIFVLALTVLISWPYVRSLMKELS